MSTRTLRRNATKSSAFPIRWLLTGIEFQEGCRTTCCMTEGAWKLSVASGSHSGTCDASEEISHSTKHPTCKAWQALLQGM